MPRPQRPLRMSLEAALDEERREVLEILEGHSSRRSSPSLDRHTSSAPVRSMLDISAGPSHSPHGLLGRIGTAEIQSSGGGSFASSIVNSQSTSPSVSTRSSTTSPPASKETVLERELPNRRSSDSAPEVVTTVKRHTLDKHGLDFNTDYQFRILPSIPHLALTKRKKPSSSNSIASQSPFGTGKTGTDIASLTSFTGRKDADHQDANLELPRNSKLPSGRGGRIPVSRGRPNSAKYVTHSGKVIDMNHAYKHLSNAALSRSGAGLSALSGNESHRGDAENKESSVEDADVRLREDDYEDGEFDSEFVNTSEDEVEDTSSGDDDFGPRQSFEQHHRGRKKLPDSMSLISQSDNNEERDVDHPRRPQSLLAAAEEERKIVSSSRKVRSLFDLGPPRPTISSVGKPLFKKSGVHPQTSFDFASTANTPVGSDDEADLCDIKHAQNLSIHMSTIDNSIPNRAIRTIIRGDFALLEQEANEGHRRQRKYLVATDLSEESAYALEWTIGTILRDGDTLFTVYAIYEETGTGRVVELNTSVQVGEGAQIIQDTTAIVGSQTEKTALRLQSNAASLLPQALSSYFSASSDSRSGSVHSRSASTTESERVHAIERITQTCVKLLRKTKLQVRVAIEVIHCKSTKHLITEAIDKLEPTLVIIGSRGRSALKGVLLGSFSNYIVSKSSVPVMVARKKLKKHTKYKKTNIRLSNNLTTPKRLALAKVD